MSAIGGEDADEEKDGDTTELTAEEGNRYPSNLAFEDTESEADGEAGDGEDSENVTMVGATRLQAMTKVMTLAYRCPRTPNLWTSLEVRVKTLASRDTNPTTSRVKISVMLTRKRVTR